MPLGIISFIFNSVRDCASFSHILILWTPFSPHPFYCYYPFEFDCIDWRWYSPYFAPTSLLCKCDVNHQFSRLYLSSQLDTPLRCATMSDTHSEPSSEGEKKSNQVNPNFEEPSQPSEGRSFFRFLPWRIGLMLLTSTVVQNFTTVTLAANYSWPKEQSNAFQNLVWKMIWWGPIFGLLTDLVRVKRERYRPVLAFALLLNSILSFCVYFAKSLYPNYDFGPTIVVMWLLEISTMLMYIPLNGVVISNGNSMSESQFETAARIGGLMAQAMIYRNAGTAISKLFTAYGSKKITTHHFAIISACLSLALIAQLFLLMKRSYFVDQRESSLQGSTVWRFYQTLVNVSKSSTSSSHHVAGTTFMLATCFTFIYYMIPDAAQSTMYTWNYNYYASYKANTSNTISFLGSVGATLGALVYAAWMFYEFGIHESKGGRVTSAIIGFAGCTAFALANLVHFIGVLCSKNSSMDMTVYQPIQSLLVQFFAFFGLLPCLSLAAMHAPRHLETAAFELFSIAMSAGSTICSAASADMMGSFNLDVKANTDYGYWKFVLICIFLKFVPMIIAIAIPNCREVDHDEVVDNEEKMNFPDQHTPNPMEVL